MVAEESLPDGYLLEQVNSFIEKETPNFEQTYRYIKNLIFDGFIPFQATVFGVPCIFKALTPAEFRYIEIIEPKQIRRVPYYFLYSVAFIDGCCVIPYREDLHEEIAEIWQKLPISTANIFVDIIQAIQHAQSECYDHLEAYLYENESRNMWLVNKEEAVKNRLIRGYERIGLNTAQESWILFNKREDIRENQERLFEHSKFIVSGFVGGKEIKKIEAAEKNRQNEERKRRQEVRLKTQKDQKIKLSNPINTVEDILAELDRQMRGEKDEHDRIIEAHEKQLREIQEARRRDLEAAVEKSKQEDRTGSKSVTQEEMKNIIQEMKLNGMPSYEDDKVDQYLNKIQDTSTKKSSALVDMKPKSIFDSDVQEEIKNLKSDS